jgi:hypothetical protein
MMISRSVLDGNNQDSGERALPRTDVARISADELEKGIENLDQWNGIAALAALLVGQVANGYRHWLVLLGLGRRLPARLVLALTSAACSSIRCCRPVSGATSFASST